MKSRTPIPLVIVLLLSASAFADSPTTPTVTASTVRSATAFGCNGCKTYWIEESERYAHAFNTTIGVEPFDCDTGEGCHFDYYWDSCGFWHTACHIVPGGDDDEVSVEAVLDKALAARSTGRIDELRALVATSKRFELNESRNALQFLDCQLDHVFAHYPLSLPATSGPE